MVRYRQQRVAAMLREADADMAILTSPVSLRYVADFREYALFQSHIPIFYAFVDANGATSLAGASNSPVASRPARAISAFNAGPKLDDEARGLAEDVRRYLGGGRSTRARVAVEPANPSVVQALMQAGIDVIDAALLMDRARAIKSADELTCIRWAIEVAQAGITRMRDVLVPGITENQLYAVLVATNVANDGEWCDGRMLCSGPRTNPWLQESSTRVIQAGELVAFDTDMIGPFGYCADVSRTWVCGDVAPTAAQRALYRRAYDEVHANISLIRAGASFREISDAGFRQPAQFIPNRYVCLAHGVGMSDEWPKIHYRQDWDALGYDGVLEKDMVICVESYVGEEGGSEGVKLEQQVLVTESGSEPLSTYPFDAELLAQ